MNKNIKKIILLVNLFHNRDYVTQQDAEKLCGIHRRSFYRYINTLSEIDIPIYRDNKVKGYKLSDKIVKRRVHFNAQELVLLVLGLQLFATQTNILYKKDIKQLIDKIITLANFPLENNLNKNELYYNNIDEKKAVSFHLNQNLLEIAMDRSFMIKITYNKNNVITTTTIYSPHIEFQHEWYVMDVSNEIRIPVDSIEHITIK